MPNQQNVIAAEGRSSRPWLRTVGAIFAGFVVVVILSIGTDAILHALKIYPRLGERMSNQLFGFATAYRTLYAILGSYITARLAPDRPMWHAMVGGVIGLILSIVGAVATWNHAEMGPHWYPLALVVTALPTAWLGGKIRENQILEKK